MVSSKKVTRKTKRTTKPVNEPEQTKGIPKLERSGVELWEPVEVKVKTSTEPVKLLSGEASLRKLLNEAPAVPDVVNVASMVTWVDNYSRWLSRVKGSKR